jgi:hypothetical protein
MDNYKTKGMSGAKQQNFPGKIKSPAFTSRASIVYM